MWAEPAKQTPVHTANTNKQTTKKTRKNYHYLRVNARVDGRLVHGDVKLGQDVAQGVVVPEAPPLRVDAHQAVLALRTLHIPHLLHVAGVGSRPCKGAVLIVTGLSWRSKRLTSMPMWLKERL